MPDFTVIEGDGPDKEERTKQEQEQGKQWALEEVERTLAGLSAAFLRTMAGSDTEAVYLIRRLSDFISALNKFREESAGRLPVFAALPDSV
jgi:hypothetical protein